MAIMCGGQLEDAPIAEAAATDEPELNIGRLRELLDGIRFAKPGQIDRAFIVLSYDPQSKSRPVLEIEFATD